MDFSNGGTGALAASTSPTVNYITATSTIATSTFAAGLRSTYLNLTGTSATSTAANGFNLSAGCFAVNGTCVGSSGSGTVNSGIQGQFAFYNAAGTTLSATSSLFLTQADKFGIGTVAPTQSLDVAGNVNISAGSAYMYNGTNVITASTTLNNYFFGSAGNLTGTGNDNTASGYTALSSVTTGNQNTVGGFAAANSLRTGSNNIAFGFHALDFATNGGTFNTAMAPMQ